MPNNESDANLVRRVRSGEKHAFAQIVRRYQSRLLQVARAYGDNGEDAADAVQNALVLAYVHLGQLQDPSRLGPWLRRVTLNCCRQSRRCRKPTVSLEAAREIGTSETAAADDRLLLAQVLSCLSPETRLTVTLYYQRALSLQEIAAFQEVPVTTVKSRLRNARARLRKEWETIMEETLIPQPADITPHVLRRLDSTGTVGHLAFSPDGALVVTAAVLEVNEQNFDALIACWESATGNLLWAVPHPSWVFCPTFLPDSRRIVLIAGLPGARGGKEGLLMVLNAATGATRQTIPRVPSGKAIAVSSDGRYVAIGGQEEYETYRASGDQGMAAIYSLTTGAPTLKIAPHLNYVTALAFSPDGEALATSAHLRDADPEAENVWRGGDIRLWETATGTLRHRLLRNDTGQRHNIAFSPDGTLIAAPNGREGEVLLWDTASGTLVRTLEESGSPVFALAFSPDGATLASGGGDRLVRLWNLRTGQRQQTLPEFAHCVDALAFSPDGTMLATADRSGTVQFWSL